MVPVFKTGITDELVDMVYDRLFEHAVYKPLVAKLGRKGVRKQLETQEWIASISLNGLCVAGLWGTDRINLVTRQGYEKKWMNPVIFRKFWKMFFKMYDKAKAKPDNGLVIPFLLRMGFRWENNWLVCSRNDLRVKV